MGKNCQALKQSKRKYSWSSIPLIICWHFNNILGKTFVDVESQKLEIFSFLFGLSGGELRPYCLLSTFWIILCLVIWSTVFGINSCYLITPARPPAWKGSWAWQKVPKSTLTCNLKCYFFNSMAPKTLLLFVIGCWCVAHTLSNSWFVIIPTFKSFSFCLIYSGVLWTFSKQMSILMVL